MRVGLRAVCCAVFLGLGTPVSALNLFQVGNSFYVRFAGDHRCRILDRADHSGGYRRDAGGSVG